VEWIKTSEEERMSGTDPAAAKTNPDAQPKRRGFFRFVLGCVYVIFLVAMVVGALAAVEYWAYLQVKNGPIGAPYKDRDPDVARQSSQKVAPQFGYEPTPGFAATRNIRLGNSYEYINGQSFKDFDEVPLEKPENEYRVFVTGGSVVYGRGPVPPADAVAEYYEVTYRWTIPHLMEQLLNADPRIREKIGGKHVRVINAGVAGHVIQNDLMRYLAKLRLYKPDLVVSLDGANEVHTVARPLKDWNYFAEGPYYEVVTETMDLGQKGLLNYITLWLKRNSYFFTWLALRKGEGPGILIENRGFSALPQDPTPEQIACRDNNVRQVADVTAIYHRVLETDGVPHVLALQPMFRNCKKKRTPMEQKIEQVTGMVKIGFYDAAETYDVLVEQIKARGKECGIDVVDLTTIFDPVKEWVFTDWCHMTNGANYVIAKALVNEVKTQVFGLPLLPDDALKTPLDAYFADYAQSARVMADNRALDAGMQVLKGYPGQEMLEVASAGKNPVTAELDLGKTVPVSRMRIVWADSQSVPKSWKMELSEDGSTWKEWFTIAETRPDQFDQWPGFEYYAAQEAPARFVRYTPLGADAGKPIRLRQWSLFK